MFKRQPFNIAIKDLKLYQDPNNPSQRQLSATFELSHPIEPGELEHHARLVMLGQSQIFSPAEAEPHFTVTYGLHHRLAYLAQLERRPSGQGRFREVRSSKGTRTSLGGASTQKDIEEKLRIPSVATVFRIDSSEGIIARNKNGEPEQILVLETTTDISTKELASALEVRLLPKKTTPAADRKIHRAMTPQMKTEQAITNKPQHQNSDEEEWHRRTRTDARAKKDDEQMAEPRGCD